MLGVHRRILRADRFDHVDGIGTMLLPTVHSRSSTTVVTTAVGGATGGDRQAPHWYVLSKAICLTTIALHQISHTDWAS